ncbi:universal stress protein [Amphritea balenae]|uniref:Universal stress protein n=1 Tax=Amphritea balenae TaxID=452629 RepID=A0A3P1SU58_9GAMM|nr:universal stress protein [Amphritea balenae]RRD00691.1 universal stress protein [Amphritea balenae]GGK68689.1 universal stress protein [Amphritea balenae]
MLPVVKKILYASDIDKGSRPAFRAAVSLCGHYNSEITFLHVLEPLSSSAQSVVDTMMNDASLNELHDQSIANVRQKLKERVDHFCQTELEENEMLSEGSVHAQVAEGVPWKTILNVADEMDADVIVMGTRTHSAVGQFLLGSTANKVMQNSKRPVLIVPLK